MRFSTGYSVKCCVTWAACLAVASCSSSDCLQVNVPSQDALTVSPEGKVSVLFQVLNCDGSPLSTDLSTQNAFSLSEDGTKLSSTESGHKIVPNAQQFRFFSLLLLDVSGSMYANLPDLKDWAKVFVDGVFMSNGSSKDAGVHEVAIYTFDGRAGYKVLADFSADHDGIVASLDKISTEDKCKSNGFCTDIPTNLNGAIVDAIHALDGARQGSGIAITDGALAIFTDGGDTAARVDRDTARLALSETNSKVYTIGLNSGDLDQEALTTFGITGSVQVNNVSDVTSKFADIASRIEDLAGSYYRLEYCTPKRAGQHDLSLDVNFGQMTGTTTVTFDATAINGGECIP
jgi:hypothetical protein